MSKIEKGNFSEHDITAEEFYEKLEAQVESVGKTGRVLDKKFDQEITITDVETKEREKVLRDIVLRYAKPEDIEGVVRASLDRKRHRKETYGAEYTEASLQEDTGNLKKLFDKSLEEDAKSSCLVLDVDGEVVGYIEFGKDPGNADTTARIFTISVLEKYFRNKFGELLLEKAILEAEKYFGAAHIVLGTQAENKGALLLYVKKFGFEKAKKNLENTKRKWKKKNKSGEWEAIKNYDVSLRLDVKKWKEKREKK